MSETKPENQPSSESKDVADIFVEVIRNQEEAYIGMIARAESIFQRLLLRTNLIGFEKDKIGTLTQWLHHSDWVPADPPGLLNGFSARLSATEFTDKGAPYTDIDMIVGIDLVRSGYEGIHLPLTKYEFWSNSKAVIKWRNNSFDPLVVDGEDWRKVNFILEQFEERLLADGSGEPPEEYPKDIWPEP